MVWNERVATTLRTIQLQDLPSPHIEIIGMAQLDCLDRAIQDGEVVPAKLPGPKCLVFLSEHHSCLRAS